MLVQYSIYIMSREQESDDSTDFSRRTFMQVSGAAAAAGVLGAGAAGTAAADHQIDSMFRNIRVREAQKAWERGYRGRADRSLALTDSGAEGRHPDLGPWNGVTATTTSDDRLKLERNAGTDTQHLGVEQPFLSLRAHPVHDDVPGVPVQLVGVEREVGHSTGWAPPEISALPGTGRRLFVRSLL